MKPAVRRPRVSAFVMIAEVRRAGRAKLARRRPRLHFGENQRFQNRKTTG